MLPFLQVMRQEAAKCGLWPQIRTIIYAVVIASVIFGIGVGAIVTHTTEWQPVALCCFVVVMFLAGLIVWCAKRTYLAWQAATLAYEQSDEPPTQLFGELDHAA